MHQYTTTTHSNLIKAILISFTMAFLVPACSHSGLPNREKNLPSTHILSAQQTHSLLRKWSAANYKSIPKHTITYTSHHPLAKKFLEINSGYDVKLLTKRTRGIGLAATIKSKTEEGKNFTNITDSAYLSNIHPANLVATQSISDNQRTTHIDIYDPRRATHKNQPLTYQPKIVTDYLNDLPGISYLNILGLVKPNKYDDHRGFYFAEPYDSDRIPIIMIHGLASSPDTFMDMSEAITADPVLREKYQIIYYFYPTGRPWVVSSSEFRKSYRKLIKKLDPQKTDANMRKTVLIGHSMGGLIARLSLSHPGEALHQAYLSDLPANTIFSKDEKKRITDYFHYKPLTEPAKVIYLATPHRGSRIANGFIGWITIKLITVPAFIVRETAEALTLRYLRRPAIPERAKKLLGTGQSSVEQLKPTNPSLIALNQMRMRKDLSSYSVIGDWGLPIYKLGTDGVVSYHSANIPHCVEYLVPANHDICDDAEAIQSVLDILK